MRRECGLAAGFHEYAVRVFRLLNLLILRFHTDRITISGLLDRLLFCFGNFVLVFIHFLQVKHPRKLQLSLSNYFSAFLEWAKQPKIRRILYLSKAIGRNEEPHWNVSIHDRKNVFHISKKNNEGLISKVQDKRLCQIKKTTIKINLFLNISECSFGFAVISCLCGLWRCALQYSK